MSEIRMAFDRVAKLAYFGVGESSVDFRRDYSRLNRDLDFLADLLGLRYETPEYVRDIIDPEEGE